MVYIKILKVNIIPMVLINMVYIKTFLEKEKNIRKDILKNISWLKDRDEFLQLYDEIIKNGEFSVDTKNESITSGMFKKILEDMLSENI